VAPAPADPSASLSPLPGKTSARPAVSARRSAWKPRATGAQISALWRDPDDRVDLAPAIQIEPYSRAICGQTQDGHSAGHFRTRPTGRHAEWRFCLLPTILHGYANSAHIEPSGSAPPCSGVGRLTAQNGVNAVFAGGCIS